MKAGAKHLFVIVRLDEPAELSSWKLAFKLLKVFDDPDAAEREAERLRSINGLEKCVYEVHSVRSALEK